MYHAFSLPTFTPMWLLLFYVFFIKKKKKTQWNIYINLFKWVPVSSTDKVSNSCIRDLGFNPRLHKKLIGVLVWWERAIIRSERHRLKTLSKKKKKPVQDLIDADETGQRRIDPTTSKQLVIYIYIYIYGNRYSIWNNSHLKLFFFEGNSHLNLIRAIGCDQLYR